MAGAPSVCSVGPVAGGIHATTEFMRADSLVTSAKVLAAAIAELPAEFGIRQ